ncbi:NAD(P)/FAD-dependent oxidoreductase [Tractidigestivibacter sp.]|uniref:NAD(P)/FAD-dependent oxidoreductase n=1 Tax=Tractidigestivibacter sp. TaxID=2847320 RepID=UPI003D8EEEFA
MAPRAKKPSRAERTRQLEKRASAVEVPSSADVVICGGGAAGIVAAISAAEAGARVVVLERALECGRTILATGGGRCNFANARLDMAHYRNPEFVAAVAGPSFLDDVLGFFSNCGLGWAEEAEGRLYPITRESSTVREVLLARAARANVTLACGREAKGIRRGGQSGQGLEVRYCDTFGGKEPRTMTANAVVLATGGGSARTAESLGIPTVSEHAALCPLACKGLDFARLDGRRAHATATLSRDGKTLAVEKGEVLFRPYGISGIATFNLSRKAQAGDTIALDFLPTLSLKQARALYARGKGAMGLLDDELAHQLSRTGDVVAAAKSCRLLVLGTTDEGHAQVSAGGIATGALDPSTLGAYGCPDLFVCGEAVDVDGDCGGFNLAWAWKSGMVAGSAAAKRCREKRKCRDQR